MKLSEPHIFKGYWWLPGREDDKVAGVLTYNPGENILLELIGCFTGNGFSIKELINGDLKKVPVIYGIDSDAKRISLFDCYLSFSANFNSGFPITKFTSGFVVIGMHINGMAEPSFYRADVRIPELTYWALPKSIKTTFQYASDSKSLQSCTLQLQSSWGKHDSICSIHIANDVELSINACASYSSGELFLNPRVEQYSYLSLRCPSRKMSLSEIFRMIYNFQDFLSLATKRHVSYESIDLWTAEGVDERHGNVSISILAKRNIVANTVKIDRDSFLLKYECMSDMIPTMLRKWMSDNEDMRPIKRHLVDSLVYKPVVGSVDFLQVMQAIEGVWWRFKDTEYRKANGISSDKWTRLKTLLEETIKSYSSIPAIAGASIDVREAVDSRHYYSHFMEKSPKRKVLDGVQLYELTVKLRNLLLCQVLELMGLNNTEISKVLSNQTSD